MTHRNLFRTLLIGGATMLLQCCLSAPVQAQSPVMTQRGTAATQKSMRITNTPWETGTKILGASTLRGFVSPYESYGEFTLVLKEDFSKLTSGTETEPDRTVNLKKPEDDIKYPWTNLQDAYFNTPGWGGENIYPANGTVWMDGYSKINTPCLDVSAGQGLHVLRFKARMPQPLPDSHDYRLMLEAAETFNWAPEWKMCEPTPYVLGNLTSEWQTYEVLYMNGGSTTLYNIVLEVVNIVDPRAKPEPFALQLDDVEVYTIKPHLPMPELNSHSNYQGDRFDISWSEVPEATDYLLSVFTLADRTPDNPHPLPQYFLEKQPVTGTSYTVEGVTSGEVYYYTVQSRNSNYTSFEPVPVMIYDIESPVLKPVTSVSEAGQYTASWNAIPMADAYMYYAYFLSRTPEAGKKVLLFEDFEQIVDAEGAASYDSPENPSFNVWDFFFPGGLKMPGWKIEQGINYQGCVCLDGWHYVIGGKQAVLMSPELDFSKDGGKVTVKVDLWGAINTEYKDKDGNFIPTIAAIGLFNYNEKTRDYEQVDLQYVREVKDRWGTFTVELANGSDKSVLGIFAVQGPDHLYIDNLEISQNYQAGETFAYPFFAKPFHPDTSIDVTIPEGVRWLGIEHRVQAIRPKHSSDRKEGDGTPYKASAYSKTETVQKDTAVVPVKHQGELTAWLENNDLRVSNPRAEEVNVYNVAGELLYTAPAGKTSLTISLPESGCYVVKTSYGVVKVVK